MINKQDTDGTKPLLDKAEFGFDDYTAGGDQGRVYYGDGAVNVALAKKLEVDEAREVLGTTDKVRYDKKLASRDVIDTARTGDIITAVRYEGDDDATVYYRDVPTYTGTRLDEIKHYFGTADLVTASGTTTLVYVNDLLDTTTYTEV